MDAPLDLATADRTALLAHIAAQEATIAAQQQTIRALAAAVATLQRRLAELERRLGSSGGRGMPGTKPASAPRSQATGKPRKLRDRGDARARSLRPTHRVVHAVARCPDCTTRLRGGWVSRRRAVIELPVAPVQIVEHALVTRRGPTCRRAVPPSLDLGGAVVGRQRLGIGLLSVIVTLRKLGRLPLRTIQGYLQTLHGLHRSVGVIVGACHQVATAGPAALREIQARIRGSAVVHFDETGWRQHGVNGYAWTASTRGSGCFGTAAAKGRWSSRSWGRAPTACCVAMAMPPITTTRDKSSAVGRICCAPSMT